MLLKDGLVRIEKRARRSKAGKLGEDISYRFPTEQVLRDRGDWYCGECHWPGRMTACSQCRMSFHSHCHLIGSMSPTHSQFVCSMCQAKISDCAGIGDVNTLIRYIMRRLQSRLSQLSAADKSVNNPTSADNADIIHLRAEYMMYRPMDFSTIYTNINENRYISISEFESDVYLAVHNIVVMNGVGSALATIAADILADCRYDVQEIRVCADCYRMSNEPHHPHWFCRPCFPPHRLVFAKHKGFPFWPAKVIRELDEGRLDVRFFGEPHERAEVQQNHVRPITEPLHRMRIKRSAGWSRAYDQLLRHQRLMSALERDPSADINQLLTETISADSAGSRIASPATADTSDVELADDQVASTNSNDISDISDDVNTNATTDVNIAASDDVTAEATSDVSDDVTTHASDDVTADVTADTSNDVNNTLLEFTNKSIDINSQFASADNICTGVNATSAEITNQSAKTRHIPADNTNQSVGIGSISAHTTDQPTGVTSLSTVSACVNGISADVSCVLSDVGGVLTDADRCKRADRGLITARSEDPNADLHSGSLQMDDVAMATNNGATEILKDSTENNAVSGPPIDTSSHHSCTAEDCIQQRSSLATLIENQQKELASLESSYDERLAVLMENHRKQLAALEQSCEERLAALEQTCEERLAALEATHQRQISRVKHKQWCVNCEREAIYHCCWNTAYCSTDCQQAHWQQDHKRSCRRKRPNN